MIDLPWKQSAKKWYKYARELEATVIELEMLTSLLVKQEDLKELGLLHTKKRGHDAPQT